MTIAFSHFHIQQHHCITNAYSAESAPTYYWKKLTTTSPLHYCTTFILHFIGLLFQSSGHSQT